MLCVFVVTKERRLHVNDLLGSQVILSNLVCELVSHLLVCPC